jgi:hypothetical protein
MSNCKTSIQLLLIITNNIPDYLINQLIDEDRNFSSSNW